MSSFRLAATLMVAAVSTALAQQPQMSVKKPTAQVTATVAETPGVASTKPSRFDCQGPFTYTLERVYGAGKPMVYDVTIEFVGAASARELGPGKCWRQRGWSFGAQALSVDRKGLLIYRVDMGTCPFFEKLTVKDGKITDYRSRETFLGTMWLEQNIRGVTNFTADTLYIGTQQNKPVPYSVYVSPDTKTREATCTP